VARKSGSYGVETKAQIVWYFRARQLAECVSVPKYSPRNFDRTVGQLQQLMANKHDIRLVPRVLAGAGIRFVIVQHLKGSKVDGASFWVGDSPAIAITLRYDRIDNFWFTLMHELAHVKYRDESVDVALMETDHATLPEIEQRANRDAAGYLVPQKKLESFIRRCGRLYYQNRLVEFANSLEVHPGIVVGQLHWRRKLKHSQFRRLLEKVKSEIVGQGLTDGWGDCPALGVT
jgi:HTH-type transcriptional regulator/antitoxin HigA